MFHLNNSECRDHLFLSECKAAISLISFSWGFLFSALASLFHTELRETRCRSVPQLTSPKNPPPLPEPSLTFFVKVVNSRLMRCWVLWQLSMKIVYSTCSSFIHLFTSIWVSFVIDIVMEYSVTAYFAAKMEGATSDILFYIVNIIISNIQISLYSS